MRHYSKRTISAYITWIRSYIRFHHNRHPQEMGEQDVVRFLSRLAINRTIAIATQQVALNALVFLYNRFLEQPLGEMVEFKRASRQAKLPVVRTQSEVSRLLKHVDPKYKLIIGILYGSGLRRMESVRLRVHDVDMDLLQLRIWNGKGRKHRFTTLALELVSALTRQIERVRLLLEEDLTNLALYRTKIN